MTQQTKPLLPARDNQPRSRTKTLLQGAAKLTFSGLALTAVLVGVEMYAPHEYKVSTIWATADANFEALKIKGTVIAQADAERMIAEARIEGERVSELKFQDSLKDVELRYQTGLKDIEFKFQRNIAIVQANLQDSLKAYDMLYQRTNMIQQVAYQMEASLMNVKQQSMTKTHGGWNIMTMLGDVGCALSSPEACRLAQEGRQKIANDLVDVSRYRSGEVSRDYLQGIQDPAQLRSRLMPNGN